ncbi:MAG: cyclic lactone autoinducer peptide [Lachnospiraceae bacterium]|nr:cyclic lactone autoinducer peptide [Lachnospiraceae bacterium]
MDKKKISKVVAESAVRVLNVSLRTEANTASCGFIYQPKEPKSLSKFKRK